MAVSLVLLAACDAGQRAESTPIRTSLPATADAGAAPRDPWLVQSAPTSAPTSDAAVDPDAIQVTWVVFPPSVPMGDEPPSLQQRVALEVTAGGVTRKKNLPSEFGGLQTFNQSACHGDAYPLEKGELAKITFYEGGAGGYFLKRTGDVLTIFEWSQTDGACENPQGDLEACPRSVNRVGKIRVKATPGATIVEQILEADDKGERHPFDCGDA